MEFTEYKMDIEIPQAKLGNYFFGNIDMPNDTLIPFTFDSGLQSETFVLQKLTFDNVKMTYSFADFLTLNNTYKKTGYFEGYTISLDVALYRIKAGTYYSKSLINAKIITGTYVDYTIIEDYDGQNIQDFDNSNIIQPI